MVAVGQPVAVEHRVEAAMATEEDVTVGAEMATVVVVMEVAIRAGMTAAAREVVLMAVGTEAAAVKVTEACRSRR